MNRPESHKENARMIARPTAGHALRSPRRGALRTTFAFACALGAWLLLAAAPAAAKVIHQSEGSFDGSGRPTLESFAGLLPSAAADQASGDVWVTEAKFFGAVGKADAVDKFNAKGEYAGVQITGEGTPQGEFAFGLGEFPGIAVDNTASGPNKGDLYLSDTGNGVVDRFSDSGAFQCQITGKKPVSVEEIAHECNGAAGSEPTGGPAGIEPAGLAVNAVGDIYVADRAHEAIDVFGPSGEYKERITGSHLGNLATIALDSAGNLYVDNFSENVVEFDSSGHFVSVIDEGNSPEGVAVDPESEHLYVGVEQENPATDEQENAIAEYEPSGALLDVFAPLSQGGFGISYLGLAVGPAGKLYAAEPWNNTVGNKVFIYGPARVVPSVTTQAATGVEDTAATLHGHVDPEAAHGGGAVESCQFEYGLTMAYGETAPCTPAPNYTSPVDVSAHITGLQPASTYHFRLEAANANGVPGTGEDETLTTPGAPSVDFETTEALTSSVTFKAKINPEGYDTTCQVQYVTDATFQQSQWASATTVPCRPEDLGSGFGDVTVKFKVTGLARAATYDYRFLATNQAGSSAGAPSTFETYGVRKLSLDVLKSSRRFNEGFPNEAWEAGEPETQAGGHPYEVVADVIMSHTTEFSHCSESYVENGACGEGEELEIVNNTALNTKDIHVELPPGVIGNPTAVPECSRYLVELEECPSDTRVGTVEVWVDFPLGRYNEVWVLPEENENGNATYYDTGLYNIEPAEHVPAEFGAFIEGHAPVWIPFHVRTGGDYGISADSINITAAGGGIARVRTRVWGVPADPAHEAEVNEGCPPDRLKHCADTGPEVPLLTTPTSCAGPQTVTASADSWGEPGQYVKKTIEIEGFTGCNQLQFKPTLEALPTTNVADSPSGLHVDLHVPQDLNTTTGFEDPKGLATADLKDAKVTLPPGLTVNPASASGLAACSSAQIELHGPEAPQCPDAAKIGRVEVDTPLVNHPLPGAVYVATPYDNPFNSLLAIYVVVNDPTTGVIVKLAGHIEANPETGQLTTTFDESPQLPFEDFKLEFFGGSRGVLRTAPTCGTYASESVLTPWSAPESGPPATWSDPFQITSAPGGAPCPAKAAEEPDSPSFSAGTETPTAGSYSPFVLHLSRADDSQELTGINTVLPPGLTAKLAGVAECSDSAIEAARNETGRQEQESPSCPAGSEVGTVNVGAGAGPAPYFAQGRVYLAGPYKGAPFSLAIITPAVAGPYDLGTVVVRAALFVNPETAQVTVKSDPIPTILDGIPLDVRSIEVKIGRPGFTLNPTSCEKMSVGGEALSILGQSAVLSDPFQVGGCEALGFKPRFSVSTSGKTSRADGASLHVTLTYPNVAQGTQANIKSVHVELPKVLPSRLSTLNHACVESVFDQNPAGCPSLSKVGSARAMTPLLAVPLEGPAYFVSRGGQKFPELVVVLQGDGITIDLHGETFISSAGITSSTFRTVPDQPITSFELTLPEGTDSALAANENFCAATKTVLVKRRVTVRVKGHKKTVTRKIKTTVTAPLIMPTTLTAQNGAVLTQSTKISVVGCSRAKTKPKKSRHGKGRK
jgi:hypothetical protein